MNPIMRRGMLAANAMHVGIYRASRGKVAGSVRGLPILLLTVPGRKTKHAHTSPVSYLRHADGWIVTGSGGGSPEEPHWFRNLRATDQATIEITGEVQDVAVAIAEGEARDAFWQQFVAAAPSFAGYQQKVTRQIPVAVLTPRQGTRPAPQDNSHSS